MGLDQYIYIQKDPKKYGKKSNKHYFRNFHSLHRAIQDKWLERGRPGTNVYDVENPNELIDMVITLEANDLQAMKDVEPAERCEEEFNKVLELVEKAFDEELEVGYGAF